MKDIILHWIAVGEYWLHSRRAYSLFTMGKKQEKQAWPLLHAKEMHVVPYFIPESSVIHRDSLKNMTAEGKVRFKTSLSVPCVTKIQYHRNKDFF